MFVADVVDTWSLQSPVIVIFREMANEDICLNREWLYHCLTSDLGTTDFELAEHLAHLHYEKRHGGIIFVGAGHSQLLKELFRIAPSMFTTECPVFMPREYLNETQLRLDSNILFYHKNEECKEYQVTDIFAVKGGEPRVLELGIWNATNGFRFQNSMNRWDRRVNLEGVTFDNSLGDYSYQANLLKNENGVIVGSSGWFQDVLFYTTDRLNLNMRTREIPPTKGWRKLDNGSWTGGPGILQRREADVCSSAVGFTFERTSDIDFPLPILFRPCSLITVMPKGTSLNMWAYIQVSPHLCVLE